MPYDNSGWTAWPACRKPTETRLRFILGLKLKSNWSRVFWGKLLGDAAAVTAMLDRLLHHGHVLQCGPRRWRTKLAAATATDSQGSSTTARLPARAENVAAFDADNAGRWLVEVIRVT